MNTFIKCVIPYSLFIFTGLHSHLTAAQTEVSSQKSVSSEGSKDEIKSTPTEIAQELKFLKQQLEALTAHVHSLEKRKSEMDYKDKNYHTDQTPLQVVHNQSNKTKVTLSGWGNRALAFYDNGRQSELKNVDANEYSTRFKINGESHYNDKTNLGATFEMDLVSNSSSSVDIGRNSDSQSAVTFTKRIIEVYAKHDNYGSLYMGQGPMATDSIGDCDLSGTGLVTEGGDLASMAGGVRFIKSTVAGTSLPSLPTAALGSGVSADRDRAVGDVWIDVLGAKRLDRVRYDTPGYKGLTLSAAFGTRDVSDFSARYSGQWKRTKIIAGIGFLNMPFSYVGANQNQTVRKGSKNYGGSAAVLFDNGISLGGTTGAKSYGDPGRKTGTMWSAKAGYQRKFFNWGLTNFAVVYGQNRALYDDYSTNFSTSYYTPNSFSEDNSQKMKICGLYVVQNVDDVSAKVSADVFGGVQLHYLTRTPYGQSTIVQASGYEFNRILATMLGARVRF